MGYGVNGGEELVVLGEMDSDGLGGWLEGQQAQTEGHAVWF
jgi:hypothetical protein